VKAISAIATDEFFKTILTPAIWMNLFAFAHQLTGNSLIVPAINPNFKTKSSCYPPFVPKFNSKCFGHAAISNNDLERLAM